MPVTINAQTYHDALNTINPYTVDPNTGQGGRYYTVDEVNAHILKQPNGVAAIQSMQNQDALRPIVMGGEQILGGAESGLSMLQEAPQWVAKNVVNPVITALGGPTPNYDRPSSSYVPTLTGLQSLSDRAGLTNNPAFIPGASAAPGLENTLAGAEKAVGGTILTGGAGVVPAAISGGLSAAAHYLAPGIPPAILAALGAGAGFIGGTATSLRQGVSNPKQMQDEVRTALGAPTTDMYQAGTALQGAIKQQNYVAAGGYGQPSSLSTGLQKQILNSVPDKAPFQVLNDTNALKILRAEQPLVTDQIASAKIGHSAPGISKMSSDGQNALIPDTDLQAKLQNSFDLAKSKSSFRTGAAEPLGFMTAGALAGGALSHVMGFHGIGEALGGELGSAAGLAADYFRSSAAAHAILDPWVRRTSIATGLGAYMGAQPGSLQQQNQ